MKNKKDVWLYSWDDECFSDDEYESKEKAIKAAKKELRQFGEFKRWVYVGKKEEAHIPCLDVEDILDDVRYRIGDEFEKSWASHIKDEDKKVLDNKLNEVFENWINEFGYKPYWSIVIDIEEIELSKVANED